MQRQRMFNHWDLLVFIINDLKDTEIFKLSFKVPTLPTWYSTNITKVYREIVRISCIRILNGHSHTTSSSNSTIHIITQYLRK